MHFVTFRVSSSFIHRNLVQDSKGETMSGGRQTGTVPKTKHNSRVRRENPVVNHIPNNLDWHETYAPQRVRKESNTNARLSDGGEENFIYEDNPWVGLAPSNRTDDDELRWSNVKSSNITPERGSSTANVDAYLSNRTMQRQENGNADDREIPSTSKEVMSRGRLKMKMEQSQRKIEELQQTQAALLSLRNKAIQQVKPVQMEEIQQHSGLLGLRNKAIQQVKPVQVDLDRMANMEARLQTMTEYANIMQALERDETTANLVEPVGDCDQQLRIKLNELLVKKAQCDNILACIESENIPVGAASVSSDDGDTSQFSRTRQGFGELDEIGRRDVTKQDNRELDHHTAASSSAYIHNKELKLEEVKNKLEQLQSLLNRVESLRESKAPQPRINGESSHVEEQNQQGGGCKNCPPNSVLEKLRTKKMDLNDGLRLPKPKYPPQDYHFNQPAMESWASSVNGATANSLDYSSEDGEVEYDESPVKLCSTSYIPQNSFPKPRHPVPVNSTNSHPGAKTPSGRETRRAVHNREIRNRQQRVPEPEEPTPNTTTLAEQITELQMQMEQMQILYQSMIEKQQVANFSPPQPWMPNLGFMQFMGPPSPQWHQHQLLVNSLNQCCQLIWHQQRELAGLRQALDMIQEEGRIYKCGGHGNNLNFDPSGLLWAQSSPQTLNNQVPPGNRTNNYWDNFRSYSRQNLLSGRNKSNEGSIAESLSRPPPPAQNDNLRRRKENRSLGSQGNASQHHSVEVSGTLNSCRSRRRYNSNLKADATAVFSLEQSIYSELETVIAEAERSPQLLLQLLTQLKNLRSQRPSPYEDGNPVGFDNDMELMEDMPAFSAAPPPRMDDLPNHIMECPRKPSPYELDNRKADGVLEDVSRILERQKQEIGFCSTEVIAELVGFLCRALTLDGKLEIRLHSALNKFKGARLTSVSDNILCTVAKVVFQSPAQPQQQQLLQQQQQQQVLSNPSDVDDVVAEQMEEEGAVGGLPRAPSAQTQSKAQSVETELAEADQTQCNSTDNIEVFGTDEAGLPSNSEQDNQELPSREENQEQPLQEP